jgi:hypothetical protein
MDGMKKISGGGPLLRRNCFLDVLLESSSDFAYGSDSDVLL